MSRSGRTQPNLRLCSCIRSARACGASVGGFVRRDHVGRDPPPVGDLIAVRASPVADQPRARTEAVATGLAPAPGPGDLAGVAEVRRQGVAQLAGVLVVEV